MHAMPDVDGNIAWYDVMFEHGIEKGVSINELKVTVAEEHHNHGGKKKKKARSSYQEQAPAIPAAASLAHAYVAPMLGLTDVPDVLRMMLCRVAVGRSGLGSSGLRRPPDDPQFGGRFDSVCTNPARQSELKAVGTNFAVFENSQAYPEYVVSYRAR